MSVYQRVSYLVGFQRWNVGEKNTKGLESKKGRGPIAGPRRPRNWFQNLDANPEGFMEGISTS